MYECSNLDQQIGNCGSEILPEQYKVTISKTSRVATIEEVKLFPNNFKDENEWLYSDLYIKFKIKTKLIFHNLFATTSQAPNIELQIPQSYYRNP